MIQTNKLHELYKEMTNINSKEFFDQVSEAENEEEREFFLVITDVILKQMQKKVIFTEFKDAAIHIV